MSRATSSELTSRKRPWPAAVERLVRAHHEDDHQLGDQRLDEPAAAKQLRLLADQIQQHTEGQQIERRADQPEQDHEAPHLADVPAVRRARPVGIDTVAGDADGRDVGEEIVQQVVLLGQQRQERQEERRHSHADHVAEVGAGSQVDVLERVGEGAPAFIDALADQRQLVAQQHEVGGLLGHIHRGVHGDADIRGVQRRRVVDPVAEKAHHMTGLLQRADDALLLAGSTSANRLMRGARLISASSRICPSSLPVMTRSTGMPGRRPAARSGGCRR
ncbi:hypothetical protein SSTU70S_04809 [Stutzerimonas stutzeri]